MIRESVRIQHPVLYAYEGKKEFLDTESAALATTEERIISVWPYLTRQAIAFSKKLKPTERVNFDLEDVFTELYVALYERDHKWSADRGRYLSFAAKIIANELCSIRDRAHTVESPRNSCCRIKEYEQERASGTITATRLKTLADIERTSHTMPPIAGDGADFDRAITEDPAGPMIAREEADELFVGLKSAIDLLDPVEAEVVVRTAGIFGTKRQTISQVAEAIGRPNWYVANLKATAMKKLRRRLCAA